MVFDVCIFFMKRCFLIKRYNFKKNVNLENKQVKFCDKNEGEKCRQYFYAILAALGALIIGTSLGWTSPALKYLVNENYTEPALSITDDEANWVAALTPAGSIFGAIPSGMIADRYGRKTTLITFCIPGIVGWLLKAYPSYVVALYIGRFVVGFVMGIFCSIIPTYLIEMAEVSVRGAVGSFFTISLNMGVVLMFMMGYFDSYRVLCEGNAALCAVYFVCLLFVPESPTFLVKQNRLEEAEKSLSRLRGPGYNVQKELIELRSFLADEMERKFTFSVLRRKANIKAMIIAFSVVIIQQFTAVDGIVAFAETIFINGNTPSPTLYVILLGVTQLAFTITSTFVVDLVGRKILLIISSCGTTICLVVLGYYFWVLENTDFVSFTWLPIVVLVIYMMTFALGLGPVVWIMCGEILGPEIKKFAFGLAAAINLLGVTVIVYFFIPLMKLMTMAGMFWMFAFLDIVSCVYIILFIPETKNKSLQQIQRELAGECIEEVDRNVPAV